MTKVLVVDDDDSVRRIISQMLALMGYEVVTARNGLEGLDRFRRESDIDLVITDLRMPVMNGYEEVQGIQRLRPGTRIICMSSYSGQALPAGTTFLAKPFSLAAMQDCVDRALSGARPIPENIHDART